MGEAPALPEVRELLALYQRWRITPEREQRRAIWRRMLEIHADNVFTIGVVSSVPQPVVASTRLRNVPEKGVYNWNPGAHFGIYRPDGFWFADSDARKNL